MNTQAFLKNLIIDVPEYNLSTEEQKTIEFEGIEKFIFNKLTSNKYRGSTLPADLAQKTKDKIHYCVSHNLPIHMSVPFGGYKKWQLPTAPLPDWAEVFNFVLLRAYLVPIAKAYKQGVLLEYFSDEIFIARMNSYPQKDVDNYNEQFAEIIKFLKKYLPENMSVKTSKIRDQISQKEILKRFEMGLPEIKAKFLKLPKSEQIKMLKKTERNYQGDISKLSTKEKHKTLMDSTLIHEAFVGYDWDLDVPWAFAKDMIAIGFRYTKSWGLHIRSSRGSAVQFWIGTGVLKKTTKEPIPTILTYQQYLTFKDQLNKEKVNLFPKRFKNLQVIQVLT